MLFQSDEAHTRTWSPATGIEIRCVDRSPDGLDYFHLICGDDTILLYAQQRDVPSKIVWDISIAAPRPYRLCGEKSVEELRPIILGALTQYRLRHGMGDFAVEVYHGGRKLTLEVR